MFRSRDGNMEIYVMNLRTKAFHRLTNHPGRDYHPVWSPEGRWIAFESHRTGIRHIYKIEPDGSNLQQLTHERNSNHHPDWSPGWSIHRFLFRRCPLDDNCGRTKTETTHKSTAIRGHARLVAGWEKDRFYDDAFEKYGHLYQGCRWTKRPPIDTPSSRGCVSGLGT